MKVNELWDLDELPVGVKHVGCKWVYNTKIDYKGNIERLRVYILIIHFLLSQRKFN